MAAREPFGPLGCLLESRPERFILPGGLQGWKESWLIAKFRASTVMTHGSGRVAQATWIHRPFRSTTLLHMPNLAVNPLKLAPPSPANPHFLIPDAENGPVGGKRSTFQRVQAAHTRHSPLFSVEFRNSPPKKAANPGERFGPPNLPGKGPDYRRWDGSFGRGFQPSADDADESTVII